MDIDLQAVVRGQGIRPEAVERLVDRPDRVVARVETDRGAVVIKASTYRSGLAPEVAANRRLAALGLPVQEVLAWDDGPPSFAMLSFVEGEPLSSDSPIAVQQEVGRILSRIHSLGGTGPYAGNPTWDGWMEGWLNHALNWWSGQGASGEHVTTARRWFGELRPLLSERGNEQILFDGRPEHFRIDGEQVSGLIDLAEMRSGDAAMDLAVLAVSDPGLLVGITEGYAPNQKEKEAFDRLVPFYLFLRRLASAEWHLQLGAPQFALRMLDLASAGLRNMTVRQGR